MDRVKNNTDWIEHTGNPVDWFEYIYSRRKSELHDVKEKMDSVSKEQKEQIINKAEQIKTIRKRLHELFKAYSGVCKSCQTKCCDEFTPSLGDYVYYAIVGFELPSPTKMHQEFLNERGFGTCYFLSEDGCVLNENRPVRCLAAVCNRLPQYLPKEVISEINGLVVEFRKEDEYLGNICK